MQQSVTKKRKRKGKIFGKLIIVIIIALYLLSRIYPLYGASGLQTYIAEYDKIEIVISTNAFIARDEKVYTSLGDGEVKYFVNQGQKVAKGQRLAEVYLENFDEKTIEELEIINLRIQNINNSTKNEGEFFERDLEKINQSIRGLIQNLQQDIDSGNFSSINTYRKELEAEVEKKNVISGDNSFGGKNLNELQDRKRVLEDRLKSNYQVIYSDIPGFIAFGSDGLEELINLKSIDNITSKDFDLLYNNQLKNQDDNISTESPIIRIVHNHKWSIFTKLDLQQAEGLEVGKSYFIRNQTDERRYKSTLRRLTLEEEEAILIFDLNETMEGSFDHRSIKVDIIKQYYEGVIVPNSALVELSGSLGVFRIDVNGFARFVPVKLKGQNNNFSVIFDGFYEEYNTKTEKVDRFKTINLYDEILRVGETVIDGQKVK